MSHFHTPRLKLRFVITTAIVALCSMVAVSRDTSATTPSNANGYLGPASYNNGPVLAKPRVIVVFWDTPGNPVSTNVVNAMPGFYSAVLGSGYTDWLQEYSTYNAGSNNAYFVRGSSTAVGFHITPSYGLGVPVTATQITGEIASQLNKQSPPMPAPNPGECVPNPTLPCNTLYMVHLPPGLAWSWSGGSSCQGGGNSFGVHGAIQANINGTTTVLNIALVSDVTGCSCPAGYPGCTCNGDLACEETVASHELVESMTDPQVNTTFGTQAWTANVSGGEIGDACVGLQSTIQQYSNGTNVAYTVQKEWSNENQGCVADSEPRSIVSVSPSQGTLSVVYRSAYNTLNTNHFDGTSWSGDTVIGGPIDSAPGVMNLGGNSLVAFVRGTDQRLYQSSWNGTSWAGFTHTFNNTTMPWNPFTGSPAVLVRDSTHSDVFVRGTDGALYMLGDDSPHGWGQYWQLMSNPIIGSPVPFARDSNHIDVYVRGTDNGLYYKKFSNGSWDSGIYQPQVGSNQITGSPFVTTFNFPNANREDVFARGTDGTLWWWAWDGSWHSKQVATNQILGSPTVVSMAANRYDVFVHFNDSTGGQLWTNSTSDPQDDNNAIWNGYTQPNNLWTGAEILGNPSAATRGTHLIDVFAQGTDSHVYRTMWDGQTWYTFRSIGGTLY